MHIKTNDTVEVIAGDDKRRRRGKVLRDRSRQAARSSSKACNRVYKHVRRSQKNPQGGRLVEGNADPDLQRAAGLPKCGKRRANRRRGVQTDGSKERFCKKCGASLGRIVARQEDIVAKKQ